jgi:hypothetical protein
MRTQSATKPGCWAITGQFGRPSALEFWPVKEVHTQRMPDLLDPLDRVHPHLFFVRREVNSPKSSFACHSLSVKTRFSNQFWSLGS